MESRNIIVIGQGDQSRYAIEIMRNYRDYIETSLWPTDLDLSKFNSYFVAIGDNYARARIGIEVGKNGLFALNAIHSSCSISSTSARGYGVLAMAGVIFNTGSKVGNFTFFATGAQIEHDCIIEDFASVSAGSVLGGHVHLKKYAAVAMGCTIFDRVTIGENSVIGSGSLVTKDVPDNQLWYGSPARFIRERKPGEKWLK